MSQGREAAAAAVQVLTDHAMARIYELTGEIPGGSHEDRAMLATAIISEILARGLARGDTTALAGFINEIFASHQFGWRLVSVS